MTMYAALRRQSIAAALRRRGFARSVAQTGGFNFATMALAGLGGIIIARAVGPTVRGEYAAVTVWMGVSLTVGGMGQRAALVYYAAREPLRAREYVATSRAMMIATGMVTLVAGFLLAPVLAHRLPAVTAGYRIAFGSSIVVFVGASLIASLQARDLHRWNVVGLIQPAFSLIAIALLWRLRRLTLDAALIVLAATMLLQLVWAYGYCRRIGLAPGRARVALVRPLLAYGAVQIVAEAPGALNAQLDQLVLSQTVPAADLGRYAIAVSISLLPVPLVSAIGNVAFPRLAAQREMTGVTRQLQRLSLLGGACLAAAMLVPTAVMSYWLVPLVFGASYRGAVPLLWILTPGSVFLACGMVTGDLLKGRRHRRSWHGRMGLPRSSRWPCSSRCYRWWVSTPRRSPRRSPTGLRSPSCSTACHGCHVMKWPAPLRRRKLRCRHREGRAANRVRRL